MGTLRAIRGNVPVSVRVATARALEFADPPAPLVRFFAMDELTVALPVLRNARMNSSEWIQLLPELAPGGRAVLRNRRDLGPIVKRALEAYGPIDFVLPDETVKDVAEAMPDPVGEIPADMVAPEPLNDASAIEPEPIADAEPEVPVQPTMETAFEQPSIAAFDTMPFAYPADDMAVFESEEPAAPEAVAVPSPEIESAPSADAERAEEVRPEPEPEPESVAQPAFAAAPPVLAAPVEAAIVEAAEAIALSEAPASAEAELEDFSFVALAGTAASLPLIATAGESQSEVRAAEDQSGTVESPASIEAIAPSAPEPQAPGMEQGDLSVTEASEEALGVLSEGEAQAAPLGGDTFEIAEVVARIDAFWRHREENGPVEPHPLPPAENFRFETDSKGVFRWVDGVSRSALVGLSLDAQSGAGVPEASRIDGIAAGAFRRRAGFANARLSIEGESDAAGDWLISAIPVFDPANGRFTGYRGTARRPRVDERAEPVRPAQAAIPADSLRQLVHELRTPTNAIAGFAEMIESEMLGPVGEIYRERASTIRAHARELLGAIDDLDLAARIDSDALALVPGRITLRPVLVEIADDLAPLTELRGSMLALPVDDLSVTGDRRAVERLLARLLATLVSASGPGERIGVNMAQDSDDMVAIAIDRPRALADYPGDSVLGIDDEREDATLLGTGFALRLARNLARELGGALLIGPESLTLRLPASDNANVGQAHLS